MREFAEKYSAMGLNVIALQRGSKRSEGSWKKYQSEKFADLDKFEREDCNIGIVCGSISGNLTVLDFDNPEFYQKFFTQEERNMLLTTTLVVESQPGRCARIFS